MASEQSAGLSVSGPHGVLVASHPDACGVQRAMERLANVPGVRFSGPDVVWGADNNGGLHDLRTPNPTKDSCPAADSLLR